MAARTAAMIATLLLLTLLPTAASYPIGCGQASALPSTTFDTLYGQLAQQVNPQTRKIVWAAFISDLSGRMQGLGFEGMQMAYILSLFPDHSDMYDILGDMGPYKLGMTCEQAAWLLTNATADPSTQLDVLQAVADAIIDIPIANQTIVNLFPTQQFQTLALQRLTAAIPISCVWGTVTVAKSVTFLISVTGSMSYSFIDSTGRNVTKLHYVTEQLRDTLKRNLLNVQQFNVIRYGFTAEAWSPQLAPVTVANVDSAAQWVLASQPLGTNNMLAGLQLATQDKNVQSIWVVADRSPDGTTASIVSLAQAWEAKAPYGHIFPIGFRCDTLCDWMVQIANATNAVYRNNEP